MRKIISFLKEARAELGKVIWPTRRRAGRLTSVVVIVTVLFAVFIGVVDLGLTRGIEAVLGVGQPKPSATKPATQTQTQTQQVPASSGSQSVTIPAPGTGNSQPNQPSK